MSGKVQTLLDFQRKTFVELGLNKIIKGKDIGKPAWAYFSRKAAIFLVVGMEIYRKQDFFHYPLVEWDEEKLRNGCEQIIYNCAGLSIPEMAFGDLSEIELQNLFELFHFQKTGDITYTDGIAEIYFHHKISPMHSSIYFKPIDLGQK
jgi:hypothetical protein